MIRALPTAWFSTKYRLIRDGQEVGHLAPAAVRERAAFSAKDLTFAFYREGMLGDFVLEFEGTILARAQKPSALTRRFTLTFEGRSYTLTAVSALKRSFVLRDGEAEVGQIRPAGLLSRKAGIDLPEAFPIPVQAFCFWLVLILWKRDDAVSA